MSERVIALVVISSYREVCLPNDVLGYLSNTLRCIARFLTFSQGCDAYGGHGHVANTCAFTLVSHLTD